MQIGMSLTTSYAIDRDPKSLMGSLTEQVKAMAELGFASLSLGDHHVTRDNYFQVLPTMAHLSAFTKDMRLIPLFLLPFYNPILLAEQLAMLDVISGGRTTVISGLGHQPEAHDAFETPLRLRVSRFTETFEIMRLLWQRNDVSYSGGHYNFSGVSINPKPISQRLPMWIGANAEPAVRRAARIADAWVISPGWTPGYMEKRLRFYRAALEEFGRSRWGERACSAPRPASGADAGRRHCARQKSCLSAAIAVSESARWRIRSLWGAPKPASTRWNGCKIWEQPTSCSAARWTSLSRRCRPYTYWVSR